MLNMTCPCRPLIACKVAIRGIGGSPGSATLGKPLTGIPAPFARESSLGLVLPPQSSTAIPGPCQRFIVEHLTKGWRIFKPTKRF